MPLPRLILHACALLALHAGLAAAAIGIGEPIRPPVPAAAPLPFHVDGQPRFALSAIGKPPAGAAIAPVAGAEDVVQVSFPAGEAGTHGRRLRWSLGRADWSACDGIEVWFRPSGDTALDDLDQIGVRGYRLTVALRDADGTAASRAAFVRPDAGAAWQRLRIPFANRWAWRVQRDRLAQVDLELGAVQGRAVSYQLRGLGGYREAPYDGPSFAIHLPPAQLLIAPEEAWSFTALVQQVPAGQPFSLRLRAVDPFGRVYERSYAVDADGRGAREPSEGDAVKGRADAGPMHIEADLPNQGQGHLTITGTLAVAGEDRYRVEWMMGSLADAPDGFRRATPWGFWPGSGRDAVELGASWSRLRIKPAWFTDPEVGGRASPLDDGTWRLVHGAPHGMRGIACWLSDIPPACGNATGHHWWKSRIDWEAYGALVRRMAAYCRQAGIRHYEVVNEPNTWPRPSMPDLVRLHQVVAAAVKAVDPEAVVMGPSTYNLSAEFLDQFLAAGGAACIDAVSIHGYGREEELAAALARVRAVMAKHGKGEAALFITEVGSNAPPNSLAEQARALVRINTTMVGSGATAVIWHALTEWGVRRSSDASVPRGLGFSIAGFDGEPTPAYIAYGVMARVLHATSAQGPVAGLPAGAAGYGFAGADGRSVRVLWATAGGAPVWTAPATGRSRVIDLMGRAEAVAPGATLTLGASPVYLETRP